MGAVRDASRELSRGWEKNECGFRYSLVVGGRCLGKLSKMQAIVGTHTVALAVSNYNNQQLQ